MKSKIQNLGLILTSLFGYLEWGGGNHMFLFQGEWQILTKLFQAPGSALHPLTVLPLIGQILLIITLFQKEPSRLLTFIGLGCLAVLLWLVFAIGLMELNYKTLFSSLPFLVVSIWVIRYHWKNRSSAQQE